jgi:hypothetical protein
MARVIQRETLPNRCPNLSPEIAAFAGQPAGLSITTRHLSNEQI